MKVFASLLPILLLSAWPGCEADDAAISTAGTHTTEATLVWQGEIAVDGCAFFVEIEGKRYKPANEEIIPDAFKAEAETAVLIKYKEHDPVAYPCGLQANTFDAVELVSISKK